MAKNIDLWSQRSYMRDILGASEKETRGLLALFSCTLLSCLHTLRELWVFILAGIVTTNIPGG